MEFASEWFAHASVIHPIAVFFVANFGSRLTDNDDTAIEWWKAQRCVWRWRRLKKLIKRKIHMLQYAIESPDDLATWVSLQQRDHPETQIDQSHRAPPPGTDFCFLFAVIFVVLCRFGPCRRRTQGSQRRLGGPQEARRDQSVAGESKRMDGRASLWFEWFLLRLPIQSQSQGSITLKIIPAIKEEDRLRESKVRLRDG